MSRAAVPLKRPARRRAGLPPLERDIVRAIREALGAMPDVVCWRNNTGEWEDGAGHRIKYGLAEGGSDLVGIVAYRLPGVDSDATWLLRVGRFFALEVKQPGKKPTAKQVRFIELVRRMGGVAEWVTSVEEAVAAIEAARGSGVAPA